MKTEAETISLLWADFRDDLSKQLKVVKLHYKGDLHGDMQDSLLWHFTRLSVLEAMVKGRQIWLSDLTRSNDEDEIRYGLRRVVDVVDQTSARWANPSHAELVKQLACETASSLDSRHTLFGFCMSDERDLVHHWGAYGGGLQVGPNPDDPFVGIGLDAGAMAYPLEFESPLPPVFLFNVIFGDESAQTLCNYWAVKARKAWEILDGGTTGLRQTSVRQLLRQGLLFVCSLVKAEGWRGEHEFRLLYLPDFGEEPLGMPQPRPDGRGTYLPLTWEDTRSPIRVVMPHPLANFHEVERRVRALQRTGGPRVLQSELKPRPLG